MKDSDIIATAPDDLPEVLGADELDAISAGAYGGSNSCEPYSGDNSCEQPSGGHAGFQELTIRPTKRVERRSVISSFAK